MSNEPDRTAETAGGRSEETRSLLDRAKDEVSSWFGDAEAASRRQRDEGAGDHTGKGPERHLDPDERIVDDITRRLTDDPNVDASRIAVESHDGSVILKGEVVTSAQRAHAEEVSAAVAGVQRLENRLLVA